MAIYRRERSTRMLVIVLVVTSLITITLDFRGGDSGPLAALGRLSLAVISPLQEAVSKVFRPVGSFFSDVARLPSLKEENERLRAQLEEIQGQQTRFLEQEAELKELRSALKLRDQLGFQTVGATVIAESPSNFEWAVTIDRGSADGVDVDMPVMTGAGLVGRVVEVGSNWSKVMLIIDPESGVGARLSASQETGILRGQRERDLRLDLVDPSTPVRAGEPVVTSGRGGIFPPGIPVGVVSEVVPDEAGLEHQVLVRPNVDFSRLGVVLVVLASGTLAAPQQ